MNNYSKKHTPLFILISDSKERPNFSHKLPPALFKLEQRQQRGTVTACLDLFGSDKGMKERKPCCRSDALKLYLGDPGLITTSSTDFDQITGVDWIQTVSCNFYLGCPTAVEADASFVWLLYSTMGNLVNFTEICCVIPPMSIQQEAGQIYRTARCFFMAGTIAQHGCLSSREWWELSVRMSEMCSLPSNGGDHPHLRWQQALSTVCCWSHSRSGPLSEKPSSILTSRVLALCLHGIQRGCACSFRMRSSIDSFSGRNEQLQRTVQIIGRVRLWKCHPLFLHCWWTEPSVTWLLMQMLLLSAFSWGGKH